MKQIEQNYKTGMLNTEDVPSPLIHANDLLVKTRASLISAGTERTKVETAQMSIVEKAFSRLDLVKSVINNVKQEGLIFTIKKAFNKLDTPISLGYSCAGQIMQAGPLVKGYKTGDRVACVGEGYAAHSEINSVPQEYAAPIPEIVDYDEAAFVGLGAIALNAVEITQVRDDESVVIIGLGLIGQIIAQILKIRGCRVLGVEIDEEKISLAKKLGIDVGINPLGDDLDASVKDFTSELGADAVIIAAASKTSLPINMAGEISRNKGRVILVGAMPIVIPRKEYYEKELTFIISRGFGPDLYYKGEEKRSYPYSYRPISIRNNMQNFISLLKHKKIDVKALISHRFNFSEAEKAYELIRTNKEKYLGIVFEYERDPLTDKRIFLSKKEHPGLIKIGFIGAGSFAQGYLLPVLRRLKAVELVGVVTASGIKAKNAAKKFCFKYCSTDYNEIFNDDQINCVFIATRHNLHAKFVIEALKKSKNIFVEKPLCINETELKETVSARNSQVKRGHLPALMIGFNRRFSPFIQEAKTFFKHRISPLVMSYRVNAGYLQADHWVHNPAEGGGRIIGEICHFIDLLQYLSGSYPYEVFAKSLNGQDKDFVIQDNLLITLKFFDGSIGTINYNSIGDISFPRERLEIFGTNSVVVIDNFKTAVFSRSGVTKKMHRFSRDMGHKNEMKHFVNSLLNEEPSLIPFEEIEATTLTTFKILESLQKRLPVKVGIGIGD